MIFKRLINKIRNKMDAAYIFIFFFFEARFKVKIAYKVFFDLSLVT